MLSTMRSSWLLFALLALVALSAAFSVEDALNIDGINAYLHHGEKRQAQGTGASSTAASTSSEEPSPTEEPSISATPSSPAAPSTSAETTAVEESSSADAASTTLSERTSITRASTTAAPTKTSSKITTPVVTTKPLVSTEVAPTTTIITIVSDGQSIVQTSVGSRTVEHTTGTATETTLPSTESSGGGGLSSTNKAIIGGVVGGVGGAILLGGIALVCWRMWGKKKRVTEDDADLMAGTGSALGDKSHSNASPFQSNLEQYHNPGGRPNAAANF